ncbi:ATP-dependent Clp protease proteolytic subunit [Pyruvatibacter sp.]|uniref:ATP-dependent Clp protease proteolytic subunit n=1 Tax=Pyruvatibacter sp. TaxID=1981328 RepID=UPI0032EAA44A
MPDLAGTKVAYFGFTGHIEPNGVTRIAAALNQAHNDNYDEVHLCFSSMGGFVADGIYLYNHMKSLPLRVVAHNMGSVCSIAVAVFCGAAKRYCSQHAMFMIHPTVINASAEGMSAERLQHSLQSTLADDSRTEDILRERTTLPDDLLQARRFRDVHITPSEALKFGLVHAVQEFTLPKGHQIIQI